MCGGLVGGMDAWVRVDGSGSGSGPEGGQVAAASGNGEGGEGEGGCSEVQSDWAPSVLLRLGDRSSQARLLRTGAGTSVPTCRCAQPPVRGKRRRSVGGSHGPRRWEHRGLLTDPRSRTQSLGEELTKDKDIARPRRGPSGNALDFPLI